MDVADEGTRMAERFFLHVGSPKTGTTFLQQVLWAQRSLAEQQGLRLPLGSFNDHYLASVDARGLADEPRYPRRVVGIWDRLVADAAGWPGDVLVSHELFAATSAERVRDVLAPLDGVDVHVVLTARDYVRQIPAEWQEHLKHRASLTFADFAEALQAHAPASSWFWNVQDYADICRRWATVVAPDHIHVVTVPAQGADTAVLWERFAGVVGLDPAPFDLSLTRSNASLRAEQAEVLRRVNARLGDRLPLPGPYPGTVKEVFAQGVLANRPGTSVGLLADGRSFAVAQGRRQADELERLGVHVVGDLGELSPPPGDLPASGTEHPERLDEGVLLDESLDAIANLLDRFAKRRSGGRPQSDLEWLVDDMQARPFKYFLVGLSEHHSSLMTARGTYKRAKRLLGRVARRGPDS